MHDLCNVISERTFEAHMYPKLEYAIYESIPNTQRHYYDKKLNCFPSSLCIREDTEGWYIWTMFDPNQQSSSFVYYFELSNPIFIFFDAQGHYKKRNMIKYFFFAYLPFVQRTPKLFMATTSRALEEYNGKAIHFLSAQYT